MPSPQVGYAPRPVCEPAPSTVEIGLRAAGGLPLRLAGPIAGAVCPGGLRRGGGLGRVPVAGGVMAVCQSGSGPLRIAEAGPHFKQCVKSRCLCGRSDPAAGGLTSVEQSLVDHVCRGKLLDLAAGDEVADEAAMRSWGDSRTCQATVIRDILRGRLAPDPDPHGLRLRGLGSPAGLTWTTSPRMSTSS